MLRKIDDGQIKTDLHYNELVKLQRESINAIGTGRYEETKKALMAKEAQFYNDLADQHKRFASNARVFSYINGAITGIDAGVATFYVASGSSLIVAAAAGAVSVFTASLAVISVRSKRKNEKLAAERRERAKSLEEGNAYGSEATPEGSFY
ncbi:hypothetical protein Micr_00527 [Candidatus Micrarchaeum sp.]|uniref:hypothetical protein n=1 Tax=Candidatus Micrarchaeum sp. TaxID=2282148 RepID=UPI000B6F2D15|nr:hypothetical protein [Candidatus Micrarchaeum sp.]OWP53136.1 MAG: hypothetical protein B2I19_04405 [Thermoplasmatales archaeon ARMAN]QRF73999.1 hypothetical protein Micr_00527 [Candidatus Micrarchaeum sp.]